jgi:hypothetical protein
MQSSARHAVVVVLLALLCAACKSTDKPSPAVGSLRAFEFDQQSAQPQVVAKGVTAHDWAWQLVMSGHGEVCFGFEYADASTGLTNTDTLHRLGRCTASPPTFAIPSDVVLPARDVGDQDKQRGPDYVTFGLTVSRGVDWLKVTMADGTTVPARLLPGGSFVAFSSSSSPPAAFSLRAGSHRIRCVIRDRDLLRTLCDTIIENGHVTRLRLPD